MSADILPFGAPRRDGPVKAPRAFRQHEPVDREIARLREIAAQSGDALLLADGPVNPDARLLELCDEALRHLTTAEKVKARRYAMHDGYPWTDEMRAEADRLYQEHEREVRRAKPLLQSIRKLHATTGPGIVAKALVVRASVTGAAKLAMSLAEDLVACKELRATLWPVESSDNAPQRSLFRPPKEPRHEGGDSPFGGRLIMNLAPLRRGIFHSTKFLQILCQPPLPRTLPGVPECSVFCWPRGKVWLPTKIFLRWFLCP